MEIERRALVPEVPEDILLYAIELIGEGLIEDAESNFGDLPNFDARIELERIKGQPWTVSYTVTFSVYEYSFFWELKKTSKGTLVRLVGSAPSKWWYALFDVQRKLENLVDTQWAAFTNFAIGYLTAVSYKSSKTKKAREHVRRAKSKVGRTQKSKKK